MKALKAALAAVVLLLTLLLSVAANAQEIDQKGQMQTAELTPQLEREIRCLAQNIYYEAGAEPYNGKVAVAQVTLNRMISGKFADTICGVVKQRTALTIPKTVTTTHMVKTGYFSKEERTETNTVYNKVVVCQFSWYCTPKAKLKLPLDNINYQESLMVAQKVLLEGFGLSQLQDALYFHATHVNPKWGKVKVAKIGNHVFYRDH